MDYTVGNHATVEFALKKVLTAYSLIGAICDINYPDKATPHPNTPARQHASTPTHQYFRSNPNLSQIMQ
jgi:hypothetical protein